MQDTEYTNELEFNETSLSTNNSELQGDLSQLIQNFDKINIKEIDPMVILSKQENFAIEDFNIIVDEIHDFIFKLLNKGLNANSVKQQVIEYFNVHNINSQEFYNWLLNNQNSLNSIFLLGYSNYYGIATSKNNEKAFNLFIDASEKNHILAQYFVGRCYLYENGTTKNDKLAFEYYEKVANKNLSYGQLSLGYCYEKGIGVEIDLKKTIYWYKKAANNTEGGYSGGIMMLGYCYSNGIGTKIDKQKAFELYQNAANLGHNDVHAQYNLALMYEKGDGITKYIDKAIYWYKKSAKQGNQDAQNKLKKLQKNQ
ncbi:kinase-like domain-containing protein [Rhizophagus irregularis DAOM 181602=DAOM 197198]|nr:kinase-like domain-containing protein [Rhizophagus irregularis DAOM 181602=DAOM 197198]